MASSPHSSVPPSARTGAQSPFVSVTSRGGVLRLILTGPTINPREAQIIAAEAHEAIRNAGRLRAVVLDLSSVGSMSSFGLGMCVDVRNAAHALAARTIVCGLRRELRELFRMMKVERLFHIVHDKEELRRALK